ncbi:MAG: hypothetical protein SF069_14270 [Phycisphaerae bacterium]|nr:hypothetical protein [Phycisphaerae bacterium]
MRLAPVRQNPLLRFFSSVKLGLLWLALILIYASVASAYAPIRGVLELSEMQIFQHWVFVLLVVLFIVTLVVTTWTRIRWNITNAGVLTVHAGLILLVGGSAFYFGKKVEGDLQLFSPKVEILAVGPRGGEQVVGKMLAEKGSRWSQIMPAFGGAVEMRVAEAKEDGLDAVAEVIVEAKLGDAARAVALSKSSPVESLGQQLKVRFVPATRVDRFYDAETAALFVRRAGAAEPEQVAALHELPRSRKRYVAGGPAIHDLDGREAASNRVEPRLPVLGLWTGWFEPWRMPIDVKTDKLPFDVRIDGYLPYVEPQVELVLCPVEESNTFSAAGPALRFRVSDGARTLANETIAAGDPRRAVSETRFPFEIVAVASEAERVERLRPFAGTHELTVTLKDPPFSRSYSISPGLTINIPNTSYDLKVESIDPAWPMITPPYEGAVTPVARVQVKNGQREFNRTVLQRFPKLSQDIDEKGVRHREPLDANIELRYRTIENGWAYFLVEKDKPLTLAMFSPSGELSEQRLDVGKPTAMRVADGNVTLTVNEFLPRAVMIQQPIVTPADRQRPGLRRGPSAIRVQVRGRGEFANWSETAWTYHADYPTQESLPIRVTYPGDGKPYELIYSRAEQSLGATIAGEKLEVEFQPGQFRENRWKSLYRFAGANGNIRRGSVETNRTDVVAGWTLFQSGAPTKDHWEYTILGVGNREGMWPMILGSILIPLGSLYAFYVKPWLIRRRKAAALAVAAAAGRVPATGGSGNGQAPSRSVDRELTEVR